jgi:hypothetical protein
MRIKCHIALLQSADPVGVAYYCRFLSLVCYCYQELCMQLSPRSWKISNSPLCVVPSTLQVFALTKHTVAWTFLCMHFLLFHDLCVLIDKPSAPYFREPFRMFWRASRPRSFFTPWVAVDVSTDM